MNRSVLLSVSVGLVLMGLAGCASTQIVSTWSDPGYEGGRIQKAMVVGDFPQETVRHTFEDDFTAMLAARGITAVPGYGVLGDEFMEKEAVLDVVRSHGVDAIFMTRVVDIKTKTTYYPPEPLYTGPRGFYLDRYEYYYPGYRFMTTPGYTVHEQVVELESGVYMTKDGALVYSALSRTQYEAPSEDEISALAGALVENLESSGIIPPPVRDGL